MDTRVSPLYLGIKAATSVMLLGMLMTPPVADTSPDPPRPRTVSCVVVNVTISPACDWHSAGK
ncbi:MAG TPA: hypothetical protein VF642_02675 [Propionibacteriaceae bacterium]